MMGTMQERWNDLYAHPRHQRMLFPTAPTGAGRIFLEYVKTAVPPTGRLLDIGCGNGRNSLALAKLGFDVYGFDGITQAILDARQRTQELNLSHTTHFQVADISMHWPYENSFFHFALDINTFASLSEPERVSYLGEIQRVLQPEALFFLFSYTIHDQYYAQFLSSVDAERLETGTKIVCMDDGIERILYTEDELLKIFQEGFIIKHKQTVVRYSKMFNVYYKRHFSALIFQKS
jgi:SAM-dependent methyltransferase